MHSLVSHKVGNGKKISTLTHTHNCTLYIAVGKCSCFSMTAGLHTWSGPHCTRKITEQWKKATITISVTIKTPLHSLFSFVFFLYAHQAGLTTTTNDADLHSFSSASAEAHWLPRESGWCSLKGGWITGEIWVQFWLSLARTPKPFGQI